ncbi:hypothetical protein SAMN05421825_3397 [Epilithonimonas hungarica]|uniref:Uncharacterized protein n=1 Tax=Epilithonimonas hungarica TaxID=454006 RepID=A0A1G7UCT2_9FLAO|nr:hypothetical protein SAMN05421825_3397 [Epilithonimonas hungarica]
MPRMHKYKVYAYKNIRAFVADNIEILVRKTSASSVRQQCKTFSIRIFRLSLSKPKL